MRRSKCRILCSLLLCCLFLFSGSLTVFAEDDTDTNVILTIKNLTDSRLNVSGNCSINSNGDVVLPAKTGTFIAFIRVKPISSTRKYKFSYRLKCISNNGGSFSATGSNYIYYKDSSTNKTLDILLLNKLTNVDLDKSITLTMPDDYGDSGRIYFEFKNTSDLSIKINVSNFVVNDMTTSDLDSSLGKLGDRIKGFFDNLVESIKGFFIPKEGFFETAKEQFDQLLSDHLGFLYEAPSMVGGIFKAVGDWDPPEQPSITLPAFNFTIADHPMHLWDEQVYTFDFLGEQPWSTLYAIYKTFVFVMLSVAMINLAIKKYHSIVGGGSSDDS